MWKIFERYELPLDDVCFENKHSHVISDRCERIAWRSSTIVKGLLDTIGLWVVETKFQRLYNDYVQGNFIIVFMMISINKHSTVWFWPILFFRCVFLWFRPLPARRRPPFTAHPPSVRLGLMGQWGPMGPMGSMSPMVHMGPWGAMEQLYGADRPMEQFFVGPIGPWAPLEQ